MPDELKTDIKLFFDPEGEADILIEENDYKTVSGKDNLVQALYLRLLTKKGELAELGHPNYGSRIHELIGYPLDRANLELLRRYVRQALLEDQRVKKVSSVTVNPRPDIPGVVEVEASVKAITGESIQIGVSVNVG